MITCNNIVLLDMHKNVFETSSLELLLEMVQNGRPVVGARCKSSNDLRNGRS